MRRTQTGGGVKFVSGTGRVPTGDPGDTIVIRRQGSGSSASGVVIFGDRRVEPNTSLAFRPSIRFVSGSGTVDETSTQRCTDVFGRHFTC